MYALGIPKIQYRRCTQVLGHEGAEPIPYESEKQDDGFWLFTFPEADEYDFRDIVMLLKANGITTIGADEQLTEKNIMKLTDLLKEQGSPDENDMIDILKRTLDSWEKPTYKGGIDKCEKAQHYYLDLEDIITDYEEEATMDTPAPSDLANLEEDDFEEGTCGYSKSGKPGKKPAGPNLGFTKRELNEGRLQQLAGIKPLYEQDNFDSRFKDAMGGAGFSDEEQDDIMSRDVGSPFPGTDDVSNGYKAAVALKDELRNITYKQLSDEELDTFSKEMMLHFIDNTTAAAAAKIYFGKKGL